MTVVLRTKELSDGTNAKNLESICGRPLGLGFNDMTGELYIVAPYFGLLVVGAGGGLATQLAPGVEGMPFAYLDALDVDPVSKIVYFTDAGAVFRLGYSFHIHVPVFFTFLNMFCVS